MTLGLDDCVFGIQRCRRREELPKKITRHFCTRTNYTYVHCGSQSMAHYRVDLDPEILLVYVGQKISLSIWVRYCGEFLYSNLPIIDTHCRLLLRLDLRDQQSLWRYISLIQGCAYRDDCNDTWSHRINSSVLWQTFCKGRWPVRSPWDYGRFSWRPQQLLTFRPPPHVTSSARHLSSIYRSELIG